MPIGIASYDLLTKNDLKIILDYEPFLIASENTEF